MRRYDPSQVKCAFGGVVISGYQDGTFVEVERNEDQYTVQVGSLGDVTRTRNRNRTGKITITLMQHAPTNDLLESLLVLDETGDLLSSAPKPLIIKDLSNGMLCLAPESWITKTPKIERGKESMGVQWVFECAHLQIIVSQDIL